jgi:hypothetical protein
MSRPDRVIVGTAFIFADPSRSGREPARFKGCSQTTIGFRNAFAIIRSTALMLPSRLRLVPKRGRVCRKGSDMRLRNASANFSRVAGVRSKRFCVWAPVKLM